MMSRFQTTICTTLALAMLASAMPTQVMADDDEWYNGEEAWFGYGLVGGAILGSVITSEIHRSRHHGGYYEHRYDDRRFIRGGYCAPTYVYREPVYYYEPAPVYYVAPQPVVYVPAAQPVVVQQQPTVIQQQAPTVYQQQAPQAQSQPVPQQAPGTEINYAPQTRVEPQTQVAQSTPTYEKYSEDRVWPFWRKTRQESFPVLTNNNPGRSEAVSGGLRSTNARQAANQQPIVVNNYYYTVPAGSTADPNAATEATTSTAPEAATSPTTPAATDQSAPMGYWTPAPGTTTVAVPVRNQSGATTEKVREYFPSNARPEVAPAETADAPAAQPAAEPATAQPAEVSEQDVRDEVTRLRQRLAQLESMLPEEAEAAEATPAPAQ